MKRSILIIEDSRAVSESLRGVLEAEGYEVDCVENGTEALKRSRESCFDIILVDYRMPGIDGAETVRQLRPRCPQAYIAGVSASHKERDFMEAGADAFFKKPFRAKKLISALKDIPSR